MTSPVEALKQRMQSAADALDFEEAQRLREMVRLVEEGASIEEAEQAVLLQSMRQRPGDMGLGTGRQRVAPPPGWKPPPRPDPLTSGRSSRRR